MKAYAIRSAISGWNVGWRVGLFHGEVFHGHTDAGPVVSAAGTAHAELGEYRLYHISRSGRFVPDVFSGIGYFIVSPRVQQALKGVPKLHFLPVVFEHLVDLPMPRLGDFSWRKSPAADRYDYSGIDMIRDMPHQPQFEKAVQGYRRLYVRDIVERYADKRTVRVSPYKYDEYYPHPPREITVSRTMLSEFHAIPCENAISVYSEAVFKRIAPFLDLDYYAIDVLRL